MASCAVDAAFSAKLHANPRRIFPHSSFSKGIYLSCSWKTMHICRQTPKKSISVICRAAGAGKVRKIGSKQVSSNGAGDKGLGFSLGREEDEGREVCPGCGVFMQDNNPEAPGYFVRPAKKAARETLEEEALETLEEEKEAEQEQEDEFLEGKGGGLDLDLEGAPAVDEEEEWRRSIDGFAPAGPGYGRVTEEKRKKEMLSKKERKVRKKIEQKEMEDVLVCARCYALRHYGNVKDPRADNFLPAFDFETAIGSRLMKASGVGRTGRTVIVMVVDAVDFDGSFPRRAAKMINDAFEDGKSKAISVVLAATKCDLLPSQISPSRLDKWVRSRARVLGVPKLNKVFLVSAHKDWGVRNLIAHVKDLAGPRGNVWVIGAQNAGKSTLINAMGKKERGKVTHLTEAAIPGTTLGILRIGGILPAKAKLYDTPGLLHPYQITMRLNREEQKMIEIRKELKPRTYRVKVGQTVHSGGLVRLDVNQASVETIYITVWASVHIPLHLGKVETANEMKEKHFGAWLQPPIGEERVLELGEWKETKMQVSGNSWDVNSIDVAIAGLGWFSLGLKGSASLSVWTYDGVDIAIREPLVLDRARFFGKPGFSISTLVSRAIREKSKKFPNDPSERKQTKSKIRNIDDSRTEMLNEELANA